MPFNVWCDHCNQHVARGVRFNAEKKAVDKYYRTTVWSFRMRCHLCGGWMELRTDPQHGEYICVEGVRRKTELADDEKDNDDSGITGAGKTRELANNPFFRMEYKIADERRAKELVPKVGAIQAANERVWSRDWEASRQLRRRFREQKMRDEDKKRRDERLRSRLAIQLPLTEEREEDRQLSQSLVLDNGPRDPVAQQIERLKRGPILLGSRHHQHHRRGN